MKNPFEYFEIISYLEKDNLFKNGRSEKLKSPLVPGMDPNYFFYGDYKETGFNLYFEDHGDILNISMTAFHYYLGKTYLEAVWEPIYLKNNPQSYIARYLAIQIKDALDKFSMSFEKTFHFKIPEFH